MYICGLLSAMYRFVFILCLSISIRSVSQSINVKTTDSLYVIGNWGTAQDLSYFPDNRYVGVLVWIGEGFQYNSDQIIPWLKQYFDHYEIPAKFVLDSSENKTKLCTIRFFINGRTVFGDLAFGHWTITRIKKEHESIFPILKEKYDEAEKVRKPNKSRF